MHALFCAVAALLMASFARAPDQMGARDEARGNQPAVATCRHAYFLTYPRLDESLSSYGANPSIRTATSRTSFHFNLYTGSNMQ